VNSNTSDTRGFTLIEIIIAIVILSVGVLGMVGTAGLVSRMIGQGKRNTRAGVVALQRMEILRQAAVSTTPHCTALAGGTATSNAITEVWTVTGAGRSRRIRIIVTYPTTRGTRPDTVNTVVACS
jgi:prepilin-type N-terminal cleavage/methylation domain-containing protein